MAGQRMVQGRLKDVMYPNVLNSFQAPEAPATPSLPLSFLTCAVTFNLRTKIRHSDSDAKLCDLIFSSSTGQRSYPRCCIMLMDNDRLVCLRHKKRFFLTQGPRFRTYPNVAGNKVHNQQSL